MNKEEPTILIRFPSEGMKQQFLGWLVGIEGGFDTFYNREYAAGRPLPESFGTENDTITITGEESPDDL